MNEATTQYFEPPDDSVVHLQHGLAQVMPLQHTDERPTMRWEGGALRVAFGGTGALVATPADCRLTLPRVLLILLGSITIKP